MGSSIYRNPNIKSVKEFVDHYIKTCPGYTLIDRAIYGSQVFSVYKKNADESHFIMLDLVSREDGCWILKSMDEASGSYYLDCPIRLLKLSTWDHPAAVAWRNNCMVYHANNAMMKNATAKLKAGDTLELYSNQSVVTFEHALAGTRRLFVGSDENGNRWRYKINTICIESIKAALVAQNINSNRVALA